LEHIIGLNLKGRDLRFANFYKSRLYNADLRDAEFQGANLEEIHLRGAILKGTQFQGANLRGVDLRGVDLRDFNLKGANFKRTQLQGANLRNADLSGMDLWQADLRDFDLRGAILRNANLREANLRNVDLREANLRNADLGVANLRNADLREANLEGTKLHNAKLILCSGIESTEIKYKKIDDLDILRNRYGMEFVHITKGTFNMGSPKNEKRRGDDETQHEVIQTKNFYMQVTEVTQRQWEMVMGDNPSRFKDCGDDCPVENVSWNDAQKFIKKLNKQSSGEYRLPTEAEWEYACRAGNATRFYTGDKETDFFRAGWSLNNSNSKTHPVADNKEPNNWGLYDMHGNVSEWCQDWYRAYPSKTVADPTGPEVGSDRVTRGGSWIRSLHYCRSANRSFSKPDYQVYDIGFRLVLLPDQP
ncbi:SUMF1/EgtB/PvdO family nonheme iron enzyme, partial [Desulfobacterales bacterium HSG17]|nr:SUMF1/EgtB/PvdO family nonheme iron enzyme [Desulfobacterales bacterium HSG17]